MTDNTTAAVSSTTSSLAPKLSNGGIFGALLSSLGVIVVSELGDKTFFIALIMSLSHPGCIVLTGAMTALTLMTILSASLGLVSSYIPSAYVHYFSLALFLVFGLKMIYEAYQMSSYAGQEEYEMVQRNIEHRRASKLSLKSDTEEGGCALVGKLKNLKRRKDFHLLWVCLESFLMTFLAEWGDRSQITTVLLAAKQNAIGVALGAILGHFACTLIAVIGGKMVADRISLKAVTYCGGIVFLGFAAWTLYSGLNSELDEDSSKVTVFNATEDSPRLTAFNSTDDWSTVTASNTTEDSLSVLHLHL